MKPEQMKGVSERGKHNSKKRFRVLHLTWHIRNGLRVEECREALQAMGYDERGRPIVPVLGHG